MPPQLLNADPLAQIIGTETFADIIMDDAPACALLDSGATASLMAYGYALAGYFEIRPLSELSDRFVNINLVAGCWVPATGFVKYNLRIPGISSYDLDKSCSPYQ